MKLTWEEIRQRIEEMDEDTLQQPALVRFAADEMYAVSDVTDNATCPVMVIREDGQVDPEEVY